MRPARAARALEPATAATAEADDQLGFPDLASDRGERCPQNRCRVMDSPTRRSVLHRGKDRPAGHGSCPGDPTNVCSAARSVRGIAVPVEEPQPRRSAPSPHPEPAVPRPAMSPTRHPSSISPPAPARPQPATPPPPLASSPSPVPLAVPPARRWPRRRRLHRCRYHHGSRPRSVAPLPYDGGAQPQPAAPRRNDIDRHAGVRRLPPVAARPTETPAGGSADPADARASADL